MRTYTTRSYAVQSATSAAAPFTIARREPEPTDVELEILYCGVCHTDLHFARNDWNMTVYPCVPGHEIVGRVTRTGDQVTRFAKVDLAAVGCMVDSCRVCPNCQAGQEQYCLAGATWTYNSEDKFLGEYTFGGYSGSIVTDASFVLRMPPALDPAAAAPLLCAGITTYSPLRHWNVGPGKKSGIIGLGGLGHMGVKLARALGAHVVLFTTSESKVEDGFRLGAHEVVLSKNAEELKKHRGSFDFILDTVSTGHDVNAYLELLKLDGSLVLVGAPPNPLPVSAFNLLIARRNFSGSAIGGIAETQEMLDFCAERGIVCDIEVIPIQKINEAWARLLRQEVKYRFVIDMESLKSEVAAR
jgi:alcohol dehydrogenase (NADP+)